LSLLLLLVPLSAFLYWYFVVETPAPKVRVGKETTYITEPLDKDGYLDYQTALNERLGKEITPEKNANVLIWKALGPTPESGRRLPAEFFKFLGSDEPPSQGDYFIGMRDYLKDRLKLDETEFEPLLDQQSQATRRLWAAKEFPQVVAWLQDNEKPLAVIVEATKRPDYYHPLVAPRNARGEAELLGALLSGSQKCRELATALVARALLRVEEGQVDEAWQDLLACHRLGRLLSRGGTLIEALIAQAVNQLANDASLVYLERAGLTTRQLRDRLKDLQALPPMAPLADKVDLAERFVVLDAAQSIRRDPARSSGGGQLFATIRDWEAEKAMALIDWNVALSDINRCYDRLVAAMREKDRAGREKELDKIEADVDALSKEVHDKGERAYLLRGKNDPNVAGKLMGDVLITLLFPATRKVQQHDDADEQTQRNLHLACALAAYQRDNGRYPAKLDDLAPKYLPAVPDDLFSGKALIYRPAEKGYLLYSVGVNGKDDGGRQHGDDPPGDDLAVRMPLPELKWKQ
jgi:hypothetical protein